MSVSGIIDPTTNQIFPTLYIGGGGSQNLGEVLAVGSQALNPQTGLPQDATDFKTLGCEEIETSKVFQGNQPFLQIGEAGDNLLIKGATVKGSILVGSGLNTESLTVGANGLVLKANTLASYGVEWAVDGTNGITGISGGTNININNTNPLIPIVNVNNPIVLTDGTDTITYSTTGILKSLGATSMGITSSTGEIDITPLAGSNLDLNVSGAGKLHIVQTGTGGQSQPAISVENNNGNANEVHIDIYKNSNSPAINDNIGVIGFHANSSTGVKTNYAQITTTINDPTNASQNGSLSVACCVNSSTPTEFFRFNGGLGTNQVYKNIDLLTNSLTTSTGTLSITQPQSSGALNITTSGSSGTIGISASGSGSNMNLLATQNMNLTGSNIIQLSAGTTNGISVIQSTGGRSQLRTSITPQFQPVDFVPEISIDNNNTNLVNINLPQVKYQKLHVLNNGVTPLNGWEDVANSYGNVDAMYLSQNAYVWMGIGSSVVIVDVGFSNIYQIITLGGGANIKAYTFFEYSGFMFIGGEFDSVNGNATPQYGLTRIYLGGGIGSYVEDPIYDSFNFINGVFSGQAVLAIGQLNGVLYVGGTFTSFSNGTALGYGFQVQNPTAFSGSQTYNDNSNAFYFDQPVYSIVEAGSYVFWGGNFSTANNGFLSLNKIGAWNSGSAWTQVSLNSFNGPVYSMSVSQTIGNNVLVGGSFSQNGVSNICYVDYTLPFNQEQNAGISVGSLVKVFCGNGGDLVATSSGDNYKSASPLTWDTLGQSYGGTTPSDIFNYNGQSYNSYNSYAYVRKTFTASQAVDFVVPAPNIIRYAGGEYQTFRLGTKFTAQSFMTDSTNSYWFPLGQPAINSSFI